MFINNRWMYNYKHLYLVLEIWNYNNIKKNNWFNIILDNLNNKKLKI